MELFKPSPASRLLRARFVVDSLFGMGRDDIAAPIGNIVCLYDSPEVLYPHLWNLARSHQLLNDESVPPEAQSYFQKGYAALRSSHHHHISDAANETNEFLSNNPESVLLPPMQVPAYAVGGFVTRLVVTSPDNVRQEAELQVYSHEQLLPPPSFNRLLVNVERLEQTVQADLLNIWQEQE